jgi:hypothetical protein
VISPKAKPVTKRKRKQGEERRTTADEEVTCFIELEFFVSALKKHGSFIVISI